MRDFCLIIIQLLLNSHCQLVAADKTTMTTTTTTTMKDKKVLNEFIIDLYDVKEDNERKESGLSIDLKIDYGNSNNDSKSFLLSTITSATQSSRSIQNRDIKILYKGSNLPSKMDLYPKPGSGGGGGAGGGLSSLIFFDYIDYHDGTNGSTNGYYIIRINKEFLVLVASIALIAFLTFMVVFCLLRCFKSKADNYYYCKYHQ